MLKYVVADWNCLVKKFEKWDSNWTYRTLSLGGRLILLKYVLFGISVYWFSLFKIMCSIIKAINRIMCNFLWGGREAGHMTDLVLWDTITRTYSCGGWNLKKLN